MRVQAPFGRRGVPVTGADDVGAYRVLHVADLDGPAPWPGQFYMLAAEERWGGGDDERPYLPRALSFLGAADGQLSFMFEDVGPGTRRLGELRAGDGLWITGPLGNGFEMPPAGPRAILVGGGVGIPPLAAWGSVLRAHGVPLVALLGFRDADYAAGAALLADAVVATDDGSVGHHGLVTELLDAELDANGDAVVYSCGPPAMLEAVRALCDTRGVPAQLALEAGMACGFGACFGCVVAVRDGGYVRVCVDGPVFDAACLEVVPAHA
ncbi:MAG TPA: dihydroorotate dehydrogenase electron transfer subunit [Solirubrobacteraceae bacterium]|jgi:NAD(P)H-flavin reductase|nr:dihydroorotate dehydrogenase electron transfer subunit [Solirubrobacteraceae bacterium]